MIVVLVATHMHSMGLSQLSAAIGGMREEVKKQHVDIRMNDRVAKTMLEYVKGCGTKDDGDVPLPGAKKRKRESLDDKEAGELNEPPIRIQAPPQPSSLTSFGPRLAHIDRLAALHQAKQATQPITPRSPIAVSYSTSPHTCTCIPTTADAAEDKGGGCAVSRCAQKSRAVGGQLDDCTWRA
jgi:hypothetical protein